jgi:insulin-like growth factor 2 receptor
MHLCGFLPSGFQFNVCGAMPACGTVGGKPAFGCEVGTQVEDLKNLKPERPVGFEKSLQLSTEGFLTLTYKGSSPTDKGERSFVVFHLTEPEVL